MKVSEADIILEGTLRRCKRHKLFKTKWIERHFVLYCRDRSRSLYSIDEYKTNKRTDLKKRFNLDYVCRVESNLSFNDPSISCSSTHQDDSIHWIFAVGFQVQQYQKDLYLVAPNESDMNLWVNEICKLCKLHRQNEEIIMQEGDISQAGESSISGMSMSSQSLDMSIIEQQQYGENQEPCVPSTESDDTFSEFNFGGIRSTRPASSRAHRHSIRRKSSVTQTGRAYSSMPNTPLEEQRNVFTQNDSVSAAKRELAEPKYLRMHHFKSVNSAQSLPRDSNPNYNNLPEPLDTRSETSSMYSSRRTEDDSLSYTSGPPIPPPRTRHTLNRYGKFQNVPISRLHMVPASTSMSQVVKVDAEDSSGETLKIDAPAESYPESVTSSEGIAVYERNGRTLIRRAPPPVDRSNKPKNLRGEEEGMRYRNLGRNTSSENGNYSSQYSSRSTNYHQTDLSKRRNLDYFEPLQLVENSSSSTVAASTRSPTPSDIEYISVDVDRTLAFKQMRRAAPSTD